MFLKFIYILIRLISYNVYLSYLAFFSLHPRFGEGIENKHFLILRWGLLNITKCKRIDQPTGHLFKSCAECHK